MTTANNLADFITELIFAERETVLEALQNEDEKTLKDTIYEYIQDCEPESEE